MLRNGFSAQCAAWCLVALPLCAACSTKAPTQSTVQAAMGSVALPSRRVRVGADHTATAFMNAVEITADSIMVATDDPEVRTQALAWKANAIPALQTVTHHPDPLVSFVDGWTLMVMMENYFATGRGRDIFGPQQPIAVDAMRAVNARVEDDVRRILEGRGDYQFFHDFVQRWAADHPLENDLYLHRSVGVAAADILGDERLGGLSSLGSMEEMALDAQTMARSYLAYAFKTILWQTELLVISMMDTTLISPLLSSVDRMAVTEAATRLMEATPGMVASERALILAETERMLDASLDRTFAMVREERGLIMADVAAMIAAEREAIFAEMRAMTPEIMDQVRVDAVSIVDHVLWRLAIAGIVLLVLLGLAWVLFGPRRGTGRVRT